MRRRAFTLGLALVPFAWSCARPPARIGVLVPGLPSVDVSGPEPRAPSVAALGEGLRDLGYRYGRDFVINGRGGDGIEVRYDTLVAELVAAGTDVIVAAGPLLPSLKRLATSIPVVMAAASDPVAEGYVQSLARPGGNFTGLSLQLVETAGEQLELLREVARGPGPVAVMAEPSSLLLRQAVDAAARKSGWPVVSLEVGGPSEIEPAFRAARGAAALIVLPSGLFDQRMGEVAELAARHGLPAMYGFRRYVEAGGLMSYNADIVAIWRRAAYFVDKVLKGNRPAELPIEQPARFQLVINRAAASALGIEIPLSLRQRADAVI